MGDEWVWAAKGWGRQVVVVEVVVVNTPVNVERVKELEEIQSYLDPISHIRNLSDFTMVINTSVDVEWIKELNGILFTVLSLADILFRSNFIHSEFV